MEQKQLQRIKITATNIKSVLISKNKKIVKLDRTKSVLVKRTKEQERRKQMEANVEKSNLGPVKKVFASISTPGKSFLSKVLDFFGFIIAGYMVKFLPKIVKGIGDFINFIKPIWNTFAKVLGFVGTIIQGIFNTFNPRKTSKELDNLDKELKIANADADDQLDELGDVVQSNKEQETTQQGPVESSTDKAEFDSNPSVTPPPEQGTPVQALNAGGTLQNPMNFDGKGVTAIRFKRDGSGSDFKLTHGGAEIYRRWTENKPLKQGNVSSSMFGLDQSISRLNRSTDSNSFNIHSTPIARRNISPTKLVTDNKKRPRTIVMTVEREVEVSSGNSNMIAMAPKLPSPLPSSSSSMRIP